MRPIPNLITDDKNVRGHLTLFIANLIFGLNVPISKSLLSLEGVTPLAICMYRMVGGAALFWVASLFFKWERVSWRDLGQLFLASFFAITLNQVSFLIGLSMTSPIDSSIVATMLPIITMLLAAVFMKEPITWLKVIGVLVGAAGAMLLILGHGNLDFGSGSMQGNLIILLGVSGFAVYLSVFKRLISRYKPVTLMKWMFLFSALCVVPFSYRSAAAVDFPAFTWEMWALFIFVIFFATFVAYMLVPVGQKYLRPTVVSMYNYMQPFVAVLAAVAMGIDVFGVTKGLAAVLVFAGVYIVVRSKSRAQLEAERRARHIHQIHLQRAASAHK